MKPVDPHEPRHTHEKTDIDFRKILMWAASLAIFLLTCAALTLVFYRGFIYHNHTLDASRSGTVMSPVRPAEPRLQPDPTRDLAAYRKEQAELLAAYGWIQRNAGMVRIPIERAMEILAGRGLPVRRPLTVETPVAVALPDAAPAPQSQQPGVPS